MINNVDDLCLVLIAVMQPLTLVQAIILFKAHVLYSPFSILNSLNFVLKVKYFLM